MNLLALLRIESMDQSSTRKGLNNRNFLFQWIGLSQQCLTHWKERTHHNGLTSQNHYHYRGCCWIFEANLGSTCLLSGISGSSRSVWWDEVSQERESATRAIFLNIEGRTIWMTGLPSQVYMQRDRLICLPIPRILSHKNRQCKDTRSIAKLESQVFEKRCRSGFTKGQTNKFRSALDGNTLIKRWVLTQQQSISFDFLRLSFRWNPSDGEIFFHFFKVEFKCFK